MEGSCRQSICNCNLEAAKKKSNKCDIKNADDFATELKERQVTIIHMF